MMKKILALLLTLICVVSFTACGNDAGNEKKEKTENDAGYTEKEAISPKEAATDAMEEFLEALISLDIEKMTKYLDNPDAMPEEAKNMSLDNIMADMPAELEPYKDNFGKVVGAMIKKISSVMEYEIKDVTEDGKEFVFTVSLTSPNMETDIFETALNDNVMNDIINKLVEQGKITETTTEDALMDMIFDEIIVIINGMELEADSEEDEFILCEKDGKWLINTEKSIL